MKVVILGIMGRTPVAGVAWQALHYLEGFRRLGHDVYYVEDTQGWPYNPETGADNCAYTVAYINRLMTWCNLGDRWAFRDVSDENRLYGLSERQLKDALNDADAIINVTGSTELQNDYLDIPFRVYLETDPGVPQIEVAQGKRYTIDFLSAHTDHFTFAESVGNPDCLLPTTQFNYRPTRQPVVLDWWHLDSAPALSWEPIRMDTAPFTTIATWQQRNEIVWKGELYTWSKDRQFLRFIDLPTRSRRPFELALACDDPAAVDLLKCHGWQVVDALPLTKDIFPYRQYIGASRGEFTVAKEQYTRLRTGWFSDRSASYLAAGRPVITQDTGFPMILPTGEGLFAFSTIDEILASLDEIETSYSRHSRAAQEIAAEYFRAETVVANLLEQLAP